MMKKAIAFGLLFSAVLLVRLGVIVSAPALERQPVPQTAGANDYLPDQWNEYVSEHGRFRVRFPGKPKDEVSSAGVHFVSYSGLLEYRVSYVDDSDIPEGPNSGKRYLEDSRAASQLMTKAANERIVSEKELTVAGHPAYFLHIQSAKGWIRNLEVVVGQRVYNVIVEGRTGRTNNVEARGDLEKVAIAFIDSFKPILRSDKP